eukprot:UN06909
MLLRKFPYRKTCFTSRIYNIPSSSKKLSIQHHRYFKISSHSPIILSFKRFSLEDSKNCTRDRVEIIDGPISLRYCGKDIPPVYRSRRNTNFVTIRFVSNSYIASTGFLLEYHNEEDERACYSHLQAASGTITSPGYPAKYPKNLNCLTRITVKR